MNAEEKRLQESNERVKHWKRWGPYLSERAWGTVREDYSADGSAWDYFPHDHARSRAYRWNEDGIAGICDRHQKICFAVALWNGRDPIFKERLFGLTGNEGNHGEDVKEIYYYLDSTPTHSYMKYLYKYPQAEFPYERLVDENRGAEAAKSRVRADRHGRLRRRPILRRVRRIREGGRRGHSYPDHGRQPRPGGRADCNVLPTVWFRNTWSWGQVQNPSCAMGSIEPGVHRHQCDRLRPAMAVLRRVRRNCCSPKTRPTTSGFSAPRTRTVTLRTASTITWSQATPVQSIRQGWERKRPRNYG